MSRGSAQVPKSATATKPARAPVGPPAGPQVARVLALLLALLPLAPVRSAPVDDLKAFLLGWREYRATGTILPGTDLNEDGVVDALDAAAAVSRYLGAPLPVVATIRGTVYQPDGVTPAASATVYCPSTGDPPLETTAGEDGKFTLTGVPAPHPVQVLIVAKVTKPGGGFWYAWAYVDVRPNATTSGVKLVASNEPPPRP